MELRSLSVKTEMFGISERIRVKRGRILTCSGLLRVRSSGELQTCQRSLPDWSRHLCWLYSAVCNVLKNVPCSGVEFGINFFACCADAFEFKPRYSVVFTDQCDGN